MPGLQFSDVTTTLAHWLGKGAEWLKHKLPNSNIEEWLKNGQKFLESINDNDRWQEAVSNTFTKENKHAIDTQAGTLGLAGLIRIPGLFALNKYILRDKIDTKTNLLASIGQALIIAPSVWLCYFPVKFAQNWLDADPKKTEKLLEKSCDVLAMLDAGIKTAAHHLHSQELPSATIAPLERQAMQLRPEQYVREHSSVGRIERGEGDIGDAHRTLNLIREVVEYSHEMLHIRPVERKALKPAGLSAKQLEALADDLQPLFAGKKASTSAENPSQTLLGYEATSDGKVSPLSAEDLIMLTRGALRKISEYIKLNTAQEVVAFEQKAEEYAAFPPLRQAPPLAIVAKDCGCGHAVA
jgi:hypothetical protein